jgi:hypothetical protein
MKRYSVIFLIISSSFLSCEKEVEEVSAQQPISPHIVVHGKLNDTAYLYTSYKDEGATIFEDGDRTSICNFKLVSDVSGTINTRIPGIYFINYNANDSLGKPLTTVTRTVHVVENSAGFLNGNYEVVSSCTAVVSVSHNSTVSVGNYTALITSGSTNNNFVLISLNIGPQRVIPFASLNGRSIQVDYFSPEYASGTASGTLSATKNTFTIESTFYAYTQAITYQCKNVYTKQLIELERDSQ